MSNTTEYRDLLPVIVETTGATLPEGFDSWGVQAVAPDMRAAGFRWAFPGGLNVSNNEINRKNTDATPTWTGDGLAVTTTWRGMSRVSGIPARALLLVAYRSADVVGRDTDTFRTGGPVASVALVDGERFVREHGRGMDLSFADLRDADLQGADLRGAKLPFANLRRANLRRADLRGAKLWGADLQGAKLPFANLRRAKLQFANLKRADLRDADLQGADLWGVKLPFAKLQFANLKREDLQDADLRGADLRGADLQGADLRGADLQGADLLGAYLQGAYLQGAKL